MADITSGVSNQNAEALQTSDAYMSDKTVIKRNGESQTLSIEKLRKRLENLLEGLATKHIDLDLIINKTVAYAQNGKLINSKSFYNFMGRGMMDFDFSNIK